MEDCCSHTKKVESDPVQVVVCGDGEATCGGGDEGKQEEGGDERAKKKKEQKVERVVSPVPPEAAGVMVDNVDDDVVDGIIEATVDDDVFYSKDVEADIDLADMAEVDVLPGIGEKFNRTTKLDLHAVNTHQIKRHGNENSVRQAETKSETIDSRVNIPNGNISSQTNTGPQQKEENDNVPEEACKETHRCMKNEQSSSPSNGERLPSPTSGEKPLEQVPSDFSID